MAIAKKALVWGLFAAGGTLAAFIFPALITLFLLVAAGYIPAGLEYEQISGFAAGWAGKSLLFGVVFLSLWHAAHRMRVVFHDFGFRMDAEVAIGVYLVATLGSILAGIYLVMIG
jgi:fumarate reductase subunit D